MEVFLCSRLIEYASAGEAKRAIQELHGADLDGRKIFVREVNEDLNEAGRRGGGTKGR